MKVSTYCLFTAIIALSNLTPLHAQMMPVYSLEFNRSGSTRVDFDGDENRDLSTQSTQLGLNWVLPIDTESTLVTSFGFEITEFNFGGEGSALWQDVETLNTAIIYERELSGKWSVISIGFAEAAYEKGASAGDAVTWGMALGGKYAKTDRFSWMLGVGFFSRLEDGDMVLPVLGFEWKVNDRLLISSLLGLGVTYDLSGDGTVYLETGFDFNLTDFRLKDDGADGASRAIRPEGLGWYVSYNRRLLEW